MGRHVEKQVWLEFGSVFQNSLRNGFRNQRKSGFWVCGKVGGSLVSPWVSRSGYPKISGYPDLYQIRWSGDTSGWN